MFKLTGIVAGMALAAGVIYALSPDQAIDIADKAKQQSQQMAAQMFSKSHAVEAEDEQVLPPTQSPNLTADNSDDAKMTVASHESESSASQPPRSNGAAEEPGKLETDPSKGSSFTTTQTAFFWTPFESKTQAQAFADFLNSKTGYPFTVLAETDGSRTKYHAVLEYETDEALTSLLKHIEAITGPVPLQAQL